LKEEFRQFSRRQKSKHDKQDLELDVKDGIVNKLKLTGNNLQDEKIIKEHC